MSFLATGVLLLEVKAGSSESLFEALSLGFKGIQDVKLWHDLAVLDRCEGLMDRLSTD